MYSNNVHNVNVPHIYYMSNTLSDAKLKEKYISCKMMLIVICTYDIFHLCFLSKRMANKTMLLFFQEMSISKLCFNNQIFVFMRNQRYADNQIIWRIKISTFIDLN